jgi:hypothetical protein
MQHLHITIQELEGGMEKHCSVRSILTDRLAMWGVFAKLVPKLLTIEQK